MKSTMYLTKRLLLLSLLGGFLTACSPKQYVQLHPVSGPIAQVDGRLVTKAEADSVEVVASYEREDMEYLALDVEVKNRTNAPLDVDPANFQMTLLDLNRQPLSQPGLVSFRQAADPDYEAGKMDNKIKNEQTRLKRAKIINTVLAVAMVVGTVAAVSSSSSPRSSGRRNDHNYTDWIGTQIAVNAAYDLIQTKRVIDYGVFADRMQRYQFENYRWNQLALKRSIVQPGESVRGFVYLPKARQAAFINLTYPVKSGSAIELQFEQTLTKQKPK